MNVFKSINYLLLPRNDKKKKKKLMLNWLLIFKQETVISKGNGCIVLSLSGQKKMFNMCLKGGPGTPVVQRNLKIKLTPGQPFWWGYGGQLSNLYSLTEESQQHQTRMGIILMNISGST